MKIKWTKLALTDLEEAVTYISCDKPSTAQKVAKIIDQKIQFLTTNPAIGRSGRVSGTRELVISETPYIVPYRGLQCRGLRVLRNSSEYILF